MSRDIFKAAAELVVGLGVGSLGGHALSAFTPQNAHVVKRVSMTVGGFVLSRLVTDSAVDYTVNKIDEAADKINEFRSEVRNKMEEEN